MCIAEQEEQGKFPITKDEIENLKKEINVGDELPLPHYVLINKNGKVVEVYKKLTVTEKHRHLMSCTYVVNGITFSAAVSFTDLALWRRKEGRVCSWGEMM